MVLIAINFYLKWVWNWFSRKRNPTKCIRSWYNY